MSGNVQVILLTLLSLFLMALPLWGGYAEERRADSM
jgi:hypothetical protein